ncbi:hypothetical protein, partial [Staphylococcus capitis]|uniref:hypothetical protein n=1 Tax=Staphylococcus capitis TaxID=29388 RepID=UPI001C9317DE
VDQLLNQLNQPSQNLNRHQPLQQPKTHPNNTIHQLKYLNATQQQTPKHNLQHPTKLHQIPIPKPNPQPLNKPIPQLKQFIHHPHSLD